MFLNLQRFSKLVAFNCIIIAFTCNSSMASFIMLDIDASDAPASETQAGFFRMTNSGINGNSDNDFSAPFATMNGVTVTALATVTDNPRFRDRGINSTGSQPPPPVQHVLRDFISAVNTGSGPAEIAVTIEDLPFGVYQISTFHFDWHVGGSIHEFDIFVSDAAGADQLKVANAAFSNADRFNNGLSYFASSNGVDDILIRVVADSMNNTAGVRFNGISITPVPEPSSVILFCFAAISLFGYRRIRRTVM